MNFSGFLATPELGYLQIKGKSPILTQIKHIFTFSMQQFGAEPHNLHESKFKRSKEQLTSNSSSVSATHRSQHDRIFIPQGFSCKQALTNNRAIAEQKHSAATPGYRHKQALSYMTNMFCLQW